MFPPSLNLKAIFPVTVGKADSQGGTCEVWDANGVKEGFEVSEEPDSVLADIILKTEFEL